MKKHIQILKISALVFISFFSCEGIDEDTINLSDIIELRIFDGNEVEISEAIGDGETIIILEAKIPSDAAADFQTVTFRASDGDFIGIGETTNQISVNADGIARTSLKLPLDNDELFLSAEVGPSGKLFKAESSILLMGVDEVINLRFLDLSGAELNEIPRGDGTTIIQLEGSILYSQDELSAIKFMVSNGIFQVTSQNTQQKNIDIDGKAIVRFIVPQNAGPIFFTAKTVSSPEYAVEQNLTLERANPDALFIEPGNITMNTMDSNGITAFLTRNNGHVSLETSASFEAFQNISGTEVTVGRFTGLTTTSNMDGEISVNFYADTNDVDLNLPVTIKVTVTNDMGEDITSEIELTVN